MLECACGRMGRARRPAGECRRATPHCQRSFGLLLLAVRSPAPCHPLPCPLQVHIENAAIDLSWDVIARFGGDPSYRLPRQFFDDFVRVSLPCTLPRPQACRVASRAVAPCYDDFARESLQFSVPWDLRKGSVAVLAGPRQRRRCMGEVAGRSSPLPSPPLPFPPHQVAHDECRHFLLLERRLEGCGSRYGALAAHDGLWESAAATAGSLGARLAVEHCTHEARGLDVLPQTVARFRSGGDKESADLLQAGGGGGGGGACSTKRRHVAGSCCVVMHEREACAAPVPFSKHSVRRFSTFPLQNVILAEEVSHCAAGVRWLRHLHAVARQSGGQGVDAAAENGEQQQQQQQQPAAGAEQQVAAGAERQRAAGGVPRPAAGGEQRPAALPEWAAEAARHASVETWFHSLIRKHFRGPLKPPFNDDARAQAGFGPEW